ncbi:MULTISPECIES: glycosyl hydrolase family 28-related protein [unclassified Listeria]|uniref:glycosyl hydrolase family 28-related protein n=1 Tax=unclassified Listeria TaxID=2642072 RepID=UPI000B58C3A5|nr:MULTISPECIES: glycosyl hydrolase family 28-related protein [unclassified Listeria]
METTIIPEIKVHNVKDFGAVGNGLADDTKAIQDAIDALYEYPVKKADKTVLSRAETEEMTKEGGIVYFPAGSYKISKTIFVDKAGVNLQGDSSLSSQIIPSGEMVNNELIFDKEKEDQPIFDFAYFNGEKRTGERSFIRNIGMSHLTFDLRYVNNVTTIRIIRPYDLCKFKNLFFFNIRGTAIQAISDTSAKLFNGKRVVGQGLILEDIHIDNSGSTQDYLKLKRDKGRVEDATGTFIHLENINESSLTNVKILACGVQADANTGLAIKTADNKTIQAFANRIGILLEGCHGVTIKESSLGFFDNAAIKLQRGTNGAQIENAYTFIQHNTFEENKKAHIQIDGGAEPLAVKGVGKTFISDNRFLGKVSPEYAYEIDNCNLVTIRDRANVKVGQLAFNTIIEAGEVNAIEVAGTSFQSKPRITDNGYRTVIMGKENVLSEQKTSYSDAYSFKTRLLAERLTIPVVKKQDLYRYNEVVVEGDIALLKEDGKPETKLIVLRTIQNGQLVWVDMKDNVIDVSQITEATVSGTEVKGKFIGGITQLRITEILSDGAERPQETGGTIESGGRFSLQYTEITANCTHLKIEGFDERGFSVAEFMLHLPPQLATQLIVSPLYNRDAASFITGTYWNIASLRFVARNITTGEEQIYAGGDLKADGTFTYYARDKVRENLETMKYILNGLDSENRVVVSVNVMTGENLL